MNAAQIYLSAGLVLFLGVLGVLGYLGYKRTTTIADFAIAGSKLGPYTLGLAYSSTTFGAAVIVGYVGWAYSWGFSSLWVLLTMLFSVSMGMILIAKKVRERNITQRSLSLPDWLGDFYGSNFIRTVVAALTLYLVFYIAAQLVAEALIFDTLLGLPYAWGVILTTVIIVAYVPRQKFARRPCGARPGRTRLQGEKAEILELSASLPHGVLPSHSARWSGKHGKVEKAPKVGIFDETRDVGGGIDR